MQTRNGSLVFLGLVAAVVAALPKTASGFLQDGSAIPSAMSVVKAHTYVSLEPVPAGREFQVAIAVEIARGYHMNSHKPTDAYLIPTTVTTQMPSGLELLDTLYPSGQMESFSFSPNKPLNVYSGNVTLRLRLKASENAPAGAVALPAMLRYQACNDTTCLPPVKLPVEIKFQLAPAGTKARMVHQEIFSAFTPLQ
jgi:DsbC/DsbD-like thiol-disulfide interchange protein